MKNVLKDQVVVLTGAGGGIGSAAAERLARHGMKVILFGGRNREKLEAARAAGYAVLRVELYGHGHSGGSFHDHNVRIWVDELVQIVDRM